MNNSPRLALRRKRSSLEGLGRAEAHVWFAAPEELGQGSLDEIGAWLSPDEQVRYSRFRRMEDRRRYLAGRAMVRGVLASYLHVDPKSLRFALNDLGRPELERRGADPVSLRTVHSG